MNDLVITKEDIYRIQIYHIVDNGNHIDISVLSSSPIELMIGSDEDKVVLYDIVFRNSPSPKLPLYFHLVTLSYDVERFDSKYPNGEFLFHPGSEVHTAVIEVLRLYLL